MTGTAWLPHS
ncbi:hypothetical protein E2C01_065052 [Portunus trituberculatus]|uniref:Uncharacterized protein n=1 Tax=Portunus trituberculatus TaxID=210409 RepID=A0A5B7HKU7_PORTR|nr:hypothetical protein [Portunus trituberculatus]